MMTFQQQLFKAAYDFTNQLVLNGDLPLQNLVLSSIGLRVLNPPTKHTVSSSAKLESHSHSGS